jgi:hypothetical protein
MTEKELTVEERNLQIGHDVLTSLLETMKLSKVIRIGLLAAGGYSSKAIAELVQSPESYVRRCKIRCRKHPPTVSKFAETVAGLPEWFSTTQQSLLPGLAAAQGLAVAEYVKNPKLLIDKPQLAKTIATQAGVKSEDSRPVFVQINLAAIQQAQQVELDNLGIESPEALDMKPLKDGVYTLDKDE